MKTAQDHIELMLSRVWLRQLETLEQNRLGIQTEDDVEKLHQFRVALRQTRSLLKLCRRYLPQEHDFFADEFKWVAGITGRVRDLDVQLLIYQSEAQNTHSIPILEEISCQRRMERTRLTKILASKRFKKLLSGWRDFISVQLLSDLPEKPKVLSSKWIKKITARQCRRLWKEGKAIKPASSAERLHRLRIRVKRFRYLLLNTGYLFDDHKQQFRQLLKTLEELQSILGNYQDADKAITRLQKMLKSKTGKSFSENTVDCAQRWIESLTRQQQEARGQFLDAFKLFKQAREAISR